MQKIIFIDYDKCVGCRNCSLACSFNKEQEFSLVKGRVGPLWIPKIGMHVPIVCQHCEKPLCMDACPMGALSRNEETGAVVRNSDVCIGCKMCVVICPMGGCQLADPKDGKGAVQKCDLCDGDPECVKHCLYGALEFVDADEGNYIKRKEAILKFTEALERI